jgi:hypothetical protein
MTRIRTVSLLGMTLPVPSWTVSGIGILVLVGIAAIIYVRVLKEPVNIVSVKEVNARLASEIEEYGLHAMEAPSKHELLEDADGAVAVRVFADHCVMIQRKTRRGVRTKLVLDLAREDLRAANQTVPRVNVLPVAHAAQVCNRGCLNPHPGAFKWWYGQRRGEWVEVWRQWPEGCMHVQLMHPPSGNWETNADGSPRVRWSCCVH